MQIGQSAPNRLLEKAEKVNTFPKVYKTPCFAKVFGSSKQEVIYTVCFHVEEEERLLEL